MNRKNTVFFLIFIVGILLTLNSKVNACSCASMMSSCEATADATAVFIGLVEDVKGTAESATYQIKVEKVFAGDVSNTIKAYSSINICGYGFAVGEKYFIYAYSAPKKGQLKEFLATYCNRILHISEAKDDLDFFETHRSKMNGSRIYGTIVEDKSTDSSLPKEKRLLPMAGVKIEVEGQGQTYKLITDKNGWFEIEGLKPGEYLIRLMLSKGFRAAGGNERKIFLNERSCSKETFGVN